MFWMDLHALINWFDDKFYIEVMKYIMNEKVIINRSCNSRFLCHRNSPVNNRKIIIPFILLIEHIEFVFHEKLLSCRISLFFPGGNIL